MEKYKIAIVSDWYYPKIGGIEYSIDALSKNLKKRGHEVHIITRGYNSCNTTGGGGMVKRIKVKPIANNGRFLRPSAYGRLFKMLKGESYDIVHAHGLDSPLAVASLFYSKKLHIPSVITNHSLIGKTPLRGIMLKIGRLLLSYPDAVIAVSKAVEEECRLMTSRPIYLIPNGIESEIKKCSRRTSREITITTVARLTKKKGVLDLIDIAVPLIRKYENVRFLIIGDGPLRGKIEKRIRKLNISQYFHFTGEIPRDKVLYLLEHSDIFILPSRKEAFGISILEAMSRGVPVVARDHSGVSDIVIHGKTGFLANYNREIISYIEKLIQNPELRKSISNEAMKILQRYSWEHIVRKVEKVYRRVIYEKGVNNY